LPLYLKKPESDPAEPPHLLDGSSWRKPGPRRPEHGM